MREYEHHLGNISQDTWSSQETNAIGSGRPLIKLQKQHSSVKTALYYVRVKTHSNHNLFAPSKGDIADNDTLAAALAQIVADELLQLIRSRQGVSLSDWILEPDSLHAIVSLENDRVHSDSKTGKPRDLTAFIAALKAATAKRINLMRNQPGSSVWQRSYQEQRVEDDHMLFRLQKKLSESDSIVLSS